MVDSDRFGLYAHDLMRDMRYNAAMNYNRNVHGRRRSGGLFGKRVGVHLDLGSGKRVSVSFGRRAQLSSRRDSKQGEDGEQRKLTRSILMGCNGLILSLTGTFSCGA